MKYRKFYNEYCLILSNTNHNAKEYYNEIINDIKIELLLTLYNIELTLIKKDYRLVKVYITAIVDVLLMINENKDINKFTEFFQNYINNKTNEHYYDNYDIIYKYCIENDIINNINDIIT